jgi:hypothetical protein
MEIVEIKEDRTWESVLQALSENGHLARFYKVPKHEMKALIKVHGDTSAADLGHVFSLTQRGKIEERGVFLADAGQERIFCMLHFLVRSMKCWVETESPVQTVRMRWKIANA